MNPPGGIGNHRERDLHRCYHGSCQHLIGWRVWSLSNLTTFFEREEHETRGHGFEEKSINFDHEEHVLRMKASEPWYAVGILVEGLPPSFEHTKDGERYIFGYPMLAN